MFHELYQKEEMNNATAGMKCLSTHDGHKMRRECQINIILVCIIITRGEVLIIKILRDLEHNWKWIFIFEQKNCWPDRESNLDLLSHSYVLNKFHISNRSKRLKCLFCSEIWNIMECWNRTLDLLQTDWSYIWLKLSIMDLEIFGK